jgi:hypothetical protein
VTTAAARRNPFELLVAIGIPMGGRGSPNGQAFLKLQNGVSIAETGSANGQLYWDDGDTVPPDDLTMHNYYSWQFLYSSTPNKAYLNITSTKSATVRDEVCNVGLKDN